MTSLFILSSGTGCHYAQMIQHEQQLKVHPKLLDCDKLSNGNEERFLFGICKGTTGSETYNQDQGTKEIPTSSSVKECKWEYGGVHEYQFASDDVQFSINREKGSWENQNKYCNSTHSMALIEYGDMKKLSKFLDRDFTSFTIGDALQPKTKICWAVNGQVLTF